MNEDFPSVLVLSPNTFNYLNGTGVTFSHFFSGWPKNRLANLHASDEPQDAEVCNRFFRMGPAELHRFLLARNTKGNEPASNTAPGEFRSWKKRLAGNSGWPESFRMSRDLKAWLDQIQPQVVYTILGPISFMEAALKIHDLYGAKLVVHHMDDWYKDAYTSGIFRFQRGKMLKLFHSIVEVADRRMTIGEDMADEYSQRFTNEFFPFQNAIDVKEFRKKIDTFSQPQLNRKILLYFGSILPFAQQQSIMDAIEMIANLKTNQPESAPLFRIVAPLAQLQTLHIDDQKRENIELIEMRNDPDQFEKEIARASALLLPTNFGNAAIQYLRYSMPTKLPGYLASGKPVLAYCPAELAQSRYLRRYQIAEVVNERSEEAFKKGLDRVLNVSVASELTEKAYNIAQQNHDLHAVRQRFQEMIKGTTPPKKSAT